MLATKKKKEWSDKWCYNDDATLPLCSGSVQMAAHSLWLELTPLIVASTPVWPPTLQEKRTGYLIWMCMVGLLIFYFQIHSWCIPVHWKQFESLVLNDGMKSLFSFCSPMAFSVPPVIDGNSETVEQLTTVLDSSVNIECVATGSPPPQLNWLRNGLPLPVSSHIRLLSAGQVLR